MMESQGSLQFLGVSFQGSDFLSTQLHIQLSVVVTKVNPFILFCVVIMKRNFLLI